MEEPAPNSVWRHHSGRGYRVLFLTNEREGRQDQYPRTVIYEGVNGKRWSGPLQDWHRRMTLIASTATDFEFECLHWRGRRLDGAAARWCADWDYLPIDETCPEWPCVCADQLMQQAGDEDRA